MTIRNLFLATLVAAVPMTAVAQSDGPVESPPAEYAGRQYVDSRGCVFIRVEVGGAVTWAPRLNRDREPLCGFQPTLAAGLGQTTGSLPSIRPDAPPVILDTASVRETSATPVPVAAVPRPGVPRRSDVTAGKAPGGGAVGGSPRGYRPVWEDGRLNPHRGPRSARGDETMRQVWTDTVPMRLVTR
jgi:hypothetical protein